jgi:hypothetical protein
MAKEFPRAEFLDYILAWISEMGTEVDRGFTGIEARKLKRTIDATQRQLGRAYADPELLRGHVSAIWIFGGEVKEILNNIRFRIDCQAELTLHAKEKELELLYVASLFSPIASIANELHNTGGRWREPRTIAEGLRQFRRRHDVPGLISIAEQYFGFFKNAQFRKHHPGKQRTITTMRLTGVNQTELLAIARFVQEHEARIMRNVIVQADGPLPAAGSVVWQGDVSKVGEFSK